MLEVLERDGIIAQVASQSAPWIASLEALVREFPDQLTCVRGLGYLVGLQLRSEPPPYVAELRKNGLLAPLAGGNVIRLLPPLTASADELARSVGILRGVLAAQEDRFVTPLD